MSDPSPRPGEPPLILYGFRYPCNRSFEDLLWHWQYCDECNEVQYEYLPAGEEPPDGWWFVAEEEPT